MKGYFSRHCDISQFTLTHHMLARVDSYPYLGMTISSDLKWHNHISHITTKASRTLGFERRNVYNCLSEVKSLAYTSLIRPQLKYASAAWDPYQVGNIQQLEKVQRRAARFVFRDYNYTTCVTGLLEHLQWPLLSTRPTNSRLTLFYKAVHDQAGISLHHLQKPLRNTRSADDTTFIALSARIFIFPSDCHRLEPPVTLTVPENISQLFPPVSALFTNSSIDILSRDTPAVTGLCPLLDIYRRTEGRRLSRPRHCSKGAQPMLKAVYRSGCRDKHNRPR